MRYSTKKLDKDNLYGSVKYICDAMRKRGLIPDDDPDSIDLTVRQLKVHRKAECGTLIIIKSL